jgi:hypothetical protein
MVKLQLIKVYRIKGIPGPTGTIRGETGVVKGPKSNLEIATIGAKLEDFDFEVGLNVVGFNLKVTGQGTVVVQEINAQCKAVLSKAEEEIKLLFQKLKPNSLGQVVIYYQEQLRLFLKYNNK